MRSELLSQYCYVVISQVQLPQTSLFLSLVFFCSRTLTRASCFSPHVSSGSSCLGQSPRLLLVFITWTVWGGTLVRYGCAPLSWDLSGVFLLVQLGLCVWRRETHGGRAWFSWHRFKATSCLRDFNLDVLAKGVLVSFPRELPLCPWFPSVLLGRRQPPRQECGVLLHLLGAGQGISPRCLESSAQGVCLLSQLFICPVIDLYLCRLMDMYIGVIIGYSRVALMAPPVAKQKTFQLVPVFLGYTFFFFFFFDVDHF